MSALKKSLNTLPYGVVHGPGHVYSPAGWVFVLKREHQLQQGYGQTYRNLVAEGTKPLWSCAYDIVRVK